MDPFVIKISEDGQRIECPEISSPPTTIKKFRNSPELKALYRFIHENDIRLDMLKIIHNLYLERLHAKKKLSKAKRAASKRKHLSSD